MVDVEIRCPGSLFCLTKRCLTWVVSDLTGCLCLFLLGNICALDMFFFSGLCSLNPFHLAMAEQHKALANALKNLRGGYMEVGRKMWCGLRKKF